MHDFEVTSYQLLDGIGLGKGVRSCIFGVGGYKWCINFFPDGWMAQHAGYVPILLERVIKANNTHLEQPYQGFPRMFDKSEMKSSLEANRDYLIIRCVLNVIKEHHTEVKRYSTVVVPQPNLQDQLCQMWKDEQGTDVTFSVGSKLFKAHRCLLAARSPVFKAEFFGPMKETETHCIKVDGIDPQIFEALLHFMYTDLMLDDEHYEEGKIAKLQHLLVAADRYGLDRLKMMCGSK